MLPHLFIPHPSPPQKIKIFLNNTVRFSSRARALCFCGEHPGAELKALFDRVLLRVEGSTRRGTSVGFSSSFAFNNLSRRCFFSAANKKNILTSSILILPKQNSLFGRFVHGDDDFRNSRFKLIPHVALVSFRATRAREIKLCSFHDEFLGECNLLTCPPPRRAGTLGGATRCGDQTAHRRQSSQGVYLLPFSRPPISLAFPLLSRRVLIFSSKIFTCRWLTIRSPIFSRWTSTSVAAQSPTTSCASCWGANFAHVSCICSLSPATSILTERALHSQICALARRGHVLFDRGASRRRFAGASERKEKFPKQTSLCRRLIFYVLAWVSLKTKLKNCNAINAGAADRNVTDRASRDGGRG